MLPLTRAVMPLPLALMVVLSTPPPPAQAEDFRALGFSYDHERFEYIWFSADLPARLMDVRHGEGEWRGYYILEGQNDNWTRALQVRVLSW